MRGRIVLAALLYMGAAPTPAAPVQAEGQRQTDAATATDQAVLEVAEEWKAAYNAKDAAAVAALYAADAQYVSAHIWR